MRRLGTRQSIKGLIGCAFEFFTVNTTLAEMTVLASKDLTTAKKVNQLS